MISSRGGVISHRNRMLYRLDGILAEMEWYLVGLG
jgi:hypothetical protein